MSTLDPLTGRVIADRYEICSLIKAGGMGAVYRAKQHSLGRDVAIKFLRPQLVDEEATRRFMSEARAASRMNHPHVVSVFDFGRTSEADGELLFLVMELVSGLDLCETVIHGGPMSLERIPAIISQTLQALAEAHHHGIIHRDVKPENIILAARRSGADHVKVIDFGIARVQSEKRVTRAGNVCGTAEYIAPESAMGEIVGPAADQYSLGVVLFELLTGQLPFRHHSPGATLLAHVSAPRPDPRVVAPERKIPGTLAEICMRAMAIRPEERFASAEAFDQALWSATRPAADARRAQPSHAPPASAPPRGATLSYPLPSDTAQPQAAPDPRPSLVGREPDLAWARAHLRAVAPPSWLALNGRSGVGKSRLLGAIGEIAEEQGAVVVSVALDPPPYNELGYRGLRRLIVQLTGLGLGDLVAGHSIGTIDRSAREGLRALSPRAPAWRTDPEATRRNAAAALAWAARRAVSSGGERVVVLIDDIKHLDAASTNALFDQQRNEPVPGFIVVSTSHDALAASGEIDVVSRELRGLSRTDALRMLAMQRSAAVLARCDDDIEPLYVEQIAGLSPSRSAGAPTTLNGLVEWKLHELSAEQRKVLQAVAIVGMVRSDKLEAVLGPPETSAGGKDTQTNLEPLLARSGFLTIRDQHVAMSHSIFGKIAVAHAPGGVLVEIHAAAEAQLSPTHAWLELRAYHAIRGRGDFQAFLALEDTARLRTSHGDAVGAIAALWQAVVAAREQIMRGEGGSATSALSVFGRKLATALINDSRLDEAQGILDEILTVAEPTDVGRALVLEQLAAIAHLRGRPAESARHRQEGLAIAERCGDGNTIERLSALLGAGADSDMTELPEPPCPESDRRPVLVVEDDRAIREGLQSVIESDGREAFGAANGKQALDVLRRIPRPGLILLDLMMPVMTGWELLERLRADRAFADIPVVVISAVSKRDQVGAMRVIQKPIEVNALISVVQEFCG